MTNIDVSKIVCKNSSEDGRYAEFVVEPLERGFGNTLGNSLRRVLLSSLPGVAANFIKIDGVSHEFSAIDGVREDVVEIVLNIKEIIARLNNCDSKTVYIDVEGPVEFTSNMITTDADIDILSNNLIATLDSGAHLKMEINFKSGVGYVSADQNRTILPPVLDVIPIDSIYSPVTKVNYFVENTRVGQITDYDKLVLQVWTNGVISANDAVSSSSVILMNYLEPFCSLGGREVVSLNDESHLTSNPSDDIPLDDLGFSVRAYNSLKRSGIDCLSQLLTLSLDQIMSIRNLGKKSCDEIIEKIKQFGWVDPKEKS